MDRVNGTAIACISSGRDASRRIEELMRLIDPDYDPDKQQPIFADRCPTTGLHYLTVEAWMQEHSPEAIADAIRRGEEFEAAFAVDLLWMEYREAALGLAPRYDRDGRRIYHTMLLDQLHIRPESW